MLDNLVKILMPPRCGDCSEEIEEYYSFCSSCFKKYKFISNNICKICGFPFELDDDEIDECISCINKKPNFNISRSLFIFDENSKKLIHKFKYYDKTNLSKIFSKLIVIKFKEIIDDADIITSIPMHKLKRVFRLYNQSHILAKEIASILKKKYIPDLLIKTKLTKSQSSLSRNLRKKNIKDSIILNEKYDISNKKILLIDDVITTGETINLSARILSKNHPKYVNVISIAKVCL